MKAVIFMVSELRDGLGGAEKRFTGLWLEFQRRGLDVRLVLYESTLRALLDTDEFSSIEQYRSRLTILPVDSSFNAKHARVSTFIREHLSEDEICHFVLYYPIFHRLKNPTIFSDVLSNLRMFTLRDHVMTHGAHLRATKVDMLDPARAKFTRRLLFWNPAKLALTSNTFVNTSIYRTGPHEERENWVVYLGRFVPVKQIEEYVKCIPFINSACGAAGIQDVKFFILGHGVLENKLRALLARDEYRGVDIEMRYDAQPASILSHSKIGVSLQKVTNYPSKSLAEMLSCGCIPIATDVGSTRLMADPAFSFFVPESFDSADLANQVVKILSLTVDEFRSRSDLARAFAENNLSISRMADYYISLYQQLAQEH